MRSGLELGKGALPRRLIVPVVAIGTVVSLATYQFAKPARAAVPAPAAAPLDDNSVNALLALDNAMETVAARVTPAIVNVTVTSQPSGDRSESADNDDCGNSDGLQQFFAPFGRT